MTEENQNEVRVDAELQAIVPKYLANRAKDCDTIRQHVAAGAFADIKRLGHNMKGTGGGYGFEEISRLGAEIESCAMANQGDRLLELAGALADYLARVKPVYR